MRKPVALLGCGVGMAFGYIEAGELPLNVLLITGDDHGVQAGCYGDQQARTPNLDRLAAQGALFQRAYVAQSSCSPSRASLLTGKFPHEHGLIGLAHLGYTMKLGMITLPALLARAGYKTGIIGKHHVAPFSDVPFQWSRVSDYRAKDNGEGDTSVSVYERGRFIEDIAGFAEEFFVKNKESGTPFFLYLNYSDPHVPFLRDVKGYPNVKHVPSEMKLFDYLKPGETTLEEVANYYNSVSRLDAGIGMVLEKLDSMGLRQNTLVIYLGDNGEPFPHAKATINQSGLHVPLIIDWPGKSLPGSMVQSPVSVVGVFPTILDAVGIKPEDLSPGVVSFRDYLGGKNEPSGAVFAEMNTHSVLQFNPQRCVFDDGYKLIMDLPASSDAKLDKLEQVTVSGKTIYYKSCRLYRLDRDPLEKTDLIGDPELKPQVEKMLQDIAWWMLETSDPWASLENAKAIARAHEQSRAEGDGLHWNGSAETQKTIPSLRYGR